MLKSKSILAPKEEADGTRISIMSRHTQNDGKTPDPRLTADFYDEHRPDFAAPGYLVGGYYGGALSFDGYIREYLTYLETQREKVIALIQRALIENITVMCIEDTPEECHRRFFIEYSKQIAETLHMPLATEIR